MNKLTLLLACLIILAPASAAEENHEPEPSEDPPCSFFAWTLDPPDYRIDEDCPPIQPPFP